MNPDEFYGLALITGVNESIRFVSKARAAQSETAGDLQHRFTLTQRCAMALPKMIYQPQGCLEWANTGYASPAGICKIMPLTNVLRFTPELGR